jgi:predicted amidohydrolase YtcJ
VKPRGDGGSRVLLRGGQFYTPSGLGPTAMLCVGSSIEWLGGDADAPRDADEVLDLDGRLVTPAFVDAHVHLSMTGRALDSLDLSGCGSLTEALVEIETYAAGLSADAIVFASGWDETGWPERRPPTLRELDIAANGRVVYAARVDSHSAAVSSALLAQDRSLTAQPGWRGDGTVERDAHHAARAVIRDRWTDSERTTALRRALRFAASRGIGSVHEVNAPHIAPVDDFALIADLAAAEALPEVVCYWGELHGGDVSAEAVYGFAGDLTVDGSIGSHTARLRERYEDGDTFGHLYLGADMVASHVVHCTERGVQAGFHVIGDAALDEVADGLRRAADVVGQEAMVRCRHRLEHVEMPSAHVIDTLADLGVVASVQPAFDAAWGFAGGLYEQRLGASRAERMNPFAALQSAGVRLAFGSDSPVTPLAPWAGVRAALHHSNAGQRLQPAQAFAAATTGGHWAARRDGAGVLSEGSAASYAVWDVVGGLRAGLPDLTVDDAWPVCVRTVVDGTTVFDALKEDT